MRSPSERRLLAAPFLMVFFFVFLTLINPPLFNEYLETLLVDYRFKIRNLISPPKVPKEILIVAVDERSLSRYGRWPWNRDLQAKLIGRILEGKPKVLGIDIFYPESESPTTDRALTDLFRKHRDRLVVALGCEVEKGRTFDGEVPDPLPDLSISRIRKVKDLHPIRACRVLLPPPPLAEAVPFGHVYTLPDRDGKLRWEPLYIEYGDEFLPSFSLQAARIALGIPPERVTIIGGKGVDLGERTIPTDRFGRLHINYLGREGTFRYVSAATVLSGKTPADLFHDKIILLGTSAISTYDMRVSPFSANMAGVEKNATVVANIVLSRFIQGVPLWVDMIVVFMTGALVAFLLQKTRARASFLLLLALLALLLSSNLFAFSHYGLRLNLIYPLLTVITEGSYMISRKYLLEERHSRKVRALFSSYVTRKVVDELIADPALAKLGGERREVTILFSDIIGFTRFSESHRPEEVVAMLNEYLDAMTDIVFRWEGTLDKFIGDAIMVFWGAPLMQEDHAERGLRCALHMLQRLGELQEKWRSEGKNPLGVGIGINSGEVLVGNIGAEGKKMDYTVIGDHVNLASRVETLTRKYGAKILITEYTLTKIRHLLEEGQFGHLHLRDLERVIVKGKEQPVEIYELKREKHGTPRGSGKE